MPLVRSVRIGGASVISNDLVRGAMEAALVVAIKDPTGSPKPLQPFLKFQKMPARAMPVVRKVLDTDDAFRQRVASVVTLDMLDRPAVLFLTRPDGWEDELEQLAAEQAQAAAAADEAKAEKSAHRRLKAAETARTKAEDRVKELTVEVERVRVLLDQERVARRQAETTAHNVTWDVDNLRKQVRELEAASEGWASEREALLAGRGTHEPRPEPTPAPDLTGVVDALRDARGALDAATRFLDDAFRAVPETSAPEAYEPLTHDRRTRPAEAHPPARAAAGRIARRLRRRGAAPRRVAPRRRGGRRLQRRQASVARAAVARRAT